MEPHASRPDKRAFIHDFHPRTMRQCRCFQHEIAGQIGIPFIVRNTGKSARERVVSVPAPSHDNEPFLFHRSNAVLLPQTFDFQHSIPRPHPLRRRTLSDAYFIVWKHNVAAQRQLPVRPGKLRIVPVLQPNYLLPLLFRGRSSIRQDPIVNPPSHQRRPFLRRRNFSAYFPRTSNSRFTLLPRFQVSTIVTSMVWGMIDTENIRPRTSAIVRLIPSTAIDPTGMS